VQFRIYFHVLSASQEKLYDEKVVEMLNSTLRPFLHFTSSRSPKSVPLYDTFNEPLIFGITEQLATVITNKIVSCSP